jgi:hypothetical protein
MAASPRILGKYGALFLHVSSAPALASVVKVADTYNARIEGQTEMLAASIKGDGFARFIPGRTSATLTCEAHFQALSALFALVDDNAASLTTVPTVIPALVRVAWKLVSWSTLPAGAGLSGTVAGLAGQQIVFGFGFVSRASLQLPFDNPIVEDFELQIDGQYEFATAT